MRLNAHTLSLALALVALAGCASVPKQQEKVDGAVAELLEKPKVQTEVDRKAQALAEGRDEGPISLSRGGGSDAPKQKPEIEIGNGKFVNEAVARAPVPTAQAPEGELTFNFENQPIQAVAKAILGDLLQLNYVIAPGVQGNVSFSTSKPIKSEQALSILEMLLSWTNNSLVFSEGRYTVMPAKEAIGGKLVPTFAKPAKGYSVRIFPLQFVSPKEMEKLLKPFARADAFVSVDTSRSMLILAGTATELENYQRTIDTFDTDWLKGMSVGVYPIAHVEVAKLMPDLDKIFGATGESPMAGMFRFVPIERTNSIIVITPSQNYLEQAQEWLQRLDQAGAESGTQLYVYDVKNVKAVDLADRLSEVFGAGGSGRSSQQRKTSSRGGVAPGLQSTEVRGMNDNSRRAESTRQAQASANTTTGGAGGGSFTVGDEETEVRITAVEENNQILVMGTQTQWGIIQSAIKRLDVEPLQVQIETKILEVRLVGNFSFGVQWYLEGLIGLNNTSDQGGGPFTNSQPGNKQRIALGSGGTARDANSSFFYAFANNEIEAAVRALQKDGNTKTLSAPSLMVLNNKEARINVGDQIPVVQTFYNPGFNTGSSGSSYNSGSVQFRDTGVQLTVTPRVNPGGLVYMEIAQEVSKPGTQDQTGNYTVSKREIETEIAVQSGQTVLLGGLIGEDDIRSETGIPGLSKIPLLGRLFGSTSHDNTRTELIILITPRVVSNSSEARDITEEYQRRFKSLPPIKGAGSDTIEGAFGNKKDKK